MAVTGGTSGCTGGTCRRPGHCGPLPIPAATAPREHNRNGSVQAPTPRPAAPLDQARSSVGTSAGPGIQHINRPDRCHPGSGNGALRAFNVEVAADGRGDGREVAFVGADYKVAAPEGAFDDAGVNDVGGASAPGEGSGGPGPAVIENFDLASGQQPGKVRLAGRASPALGNDRGGDSQRETAEQQGTMAGPHRPLTALGGNQRPGVVRDPVTPTAEVPAGWVTRAAHSSASAISSRVNGHAAFGMYARRDGLAR